jgi:hypothetical protein
MRSNPGRRCGKPATNRLSYGTASVALYVKRENTEAIAVHNRLIGRDFEPNDDLYLP